MQLTKNYNFKKPDGADTVDINDINGNMDTIDDALTPTADQTQVPSSTKPAKISLWLSWITNRIKAITGKPNWYDAPDASLADIVTVAAPNKVLKLDNNSKLPASITGDANTLDGKNASDFAAVNHTHASDPVLADIVSVAAPNKILRLDNTGKLPASITGDANTLDGKNASDFAAVNHTHAFSAPMYVRTGTISDQAVITPTAGYANHQYLVSLCYAEYGVNFQNPLQQVGVYPNYQTVAIDTTRVGINCSIDANLRVTARILTDNNQWVSGVANFLEICWN